MKKLLCLLLSLILLVSCSMVAVAEDVIEVHCWYQNAQYEPWLSKMVDDFNAANPGIKIVYEFMGDDNALTAALMAAFQDGSAPTLFHTRSNASFATYVSEGVLEDLSGYDFVSTINEAGKTAATVDGGLYAACFGYSGFCVIYNQDIFDELGLTAPTNYDEMVQVVKACQDAGYGGIAYPGGMAGHVWLSRAMFHTTMGTQGYKDFEEGIDRGDITDVTAVPGAVDAMRSMAAYYEDGLWYNGADSMDGEARKTLFVNKECAMIVNYTGSMIADPSLADMNMGIFPLMSKTGNNSYYAEVNNMISMYAGASDEQKEAGAEFIDFLRQPENLEYYATNVGEIVTADGVVAEHKYGKLFADEFATRGTTMRSLCTDYMPEMWKSELDAMLLGFMFSGLDVDEQVEAFNEHLVEADIKNML